MSHLIYFIFSKRAQKAAVGCTLGISLLTIYSGAQWDYRDWDNRPPGCVPTAPGQQLTKEQTASELGKFDFTPILTRTKNSLIYGIIGNNYQRFRIHFDRVIKKPANVLEYDVVGKTKGRDTVCDFSGTITITNAHLDSKEEILNDVSDCDKTVAATVAMRGTIFADFEFRENPAQKNAGILKGKAWMSFYVGTDGELHYDDIQNFSDNFANNQFSGTWAAYGGRTAKPVRWGDWRIPDSMALDVGAGEFWPAKEYIHNGWEFFADKENVFKHTSPGHVTRIEEPDWWK